LDYLVSTLTRPFSKGQEEEKEGNDAMDSLTSHMAGISIMPKQPQPQGPVEQGPGLLPVDPGQGQVEQQQDQGTTTTTAAGVPDTEPLRRFFHFVKRKMFAYVSPTFRLLDITRDNTGEDIMKWVDNNIKHVTAFIHPGYKDHCHARLAGILAKPTVKNFDIRLVSQDDPKSWPNPDLSDLVCCHWGLHVYFQNQKGIQMLLSCLRDSESSAIPAPRFMALVLDRAKLMEMIHGFPATGESSKNAFTSMLQEDSCLGFLHRHSMKMEDFLGFMAFHGYQVDLDYPLEEFVPDWHAYGNEINEMELGYLSCYRYLVLKKKM